VASANPWRLLANTRAPSVLDDRRVPIGSGPAPVDRACCPVTVFGGCGRLGAGRVAAGDVVAGTTADEPQPTAVSATEIDAIQPAARPT
jgi:hypothetical protein